MAIGGEYAVDDERETPISILHRGVVNLSLAERSFEPASGILFGTVESSNISWFPTSNTSWYDTTDETVAASYIWTPLIASTLTRPTIEREEQLRTHRPRELPEFFKCKQCGHVTKACQFSSFEKFYVALEERKLCNKCFERLMQKKFVDDEPVDDGKRRNKRVEAMLESLKNDQ